MSAADIFLFFYNYLVPTPDSDALHQNLRRGWTCRAPDSIFASL